MIPGSGAVVGAAISADPGIAGICFTGSTATALHINRNMARQLAPQAPLIAETGGLNAMIVDSTALPEQVVRDVLASSFQSAGQRCSALRMLYLQNDVADKILKMLFGAMDELCIGDPWYLNTDVGPVIDNLAKQKIDTHCERMASQGRVLKSLPTPDSGLFVAPTVIQLDGIEQLEEEIFGPILHVARFEANQIDAVVDAINAQGYGLTFGIHTRVDTRVEQVVKRIRAGNIYVNRNQIGAVVGTQPFGGEGLSGTGPKAGGPCYIKRFVKQLIVQSSEANMPPFDAGQLQVLLDQRLDKIAGIDQLNKLAHSLKVDCDLESAIKVEDMPGPTGEKNQLSAHPRGRVLCLGPSRALAAQQALIALAQHNSVVIVAQSGDELAGIFRQAGVPVQGVDAKLQSRALTQANGFAAVMSQADSSTLSAYRSALAEREGILIPLICETNAVERLILERHLCVDTTAAGGNASLIAIS